MPDPNRLADGRQIRQGIQDIVVGLTREFFVLGVADMLDVAQQQIRHRHELLKLRKKRLLAGKRLQRSVDTCVDTTLFGLNKQLKEKVDLQERFAATDGNAALIAPVAFVALGHVEQLICGEPLGVRRLPFPGVRVVAIATAHLTSLEKNQEADAGSVDRSKRLGGMDGTFHFALLLEQ